MALTIAWMIVMGFAAFAMTLSAYEMGKDDIIGGLLQLSIALLIWFFALMPVLV